MGQNWKPWEKSKNKTKELIKINIACFLVFRVVTSVAVPQTEAGRSVRISRQDARETVEDWSAEKDSRVRKLAFYSERKRFGQFSAVNAFH